MNNQEKIKEKNGDVSWTVFKIAFTELKILFYSPVAWFVLAIFMFQCGMAYTNILGENFLLQQIGGEMGGRLPFLTTSVFGMFRGIFVSMNGYIYLYVPLLTMGLISREMSSGTISLLYSSPTKIREIVLGKYFAMMLFCLILLSVTGIFVIMGIYNIENADIGLLLSCMLGLYLVMCTYSAIGLFMSSLTSYQIVAAISTLAFLGMLNYVGEIWQGKDFVRDLTSFLSISGRNARMFWGLITSRDVIYFLVIIGLFLYITIYKLQSMRQSVPLWTKASRYVLVLVVALTIGYISSRPGFVGYLDATETKRNTLTENTQRIVRSFNNQPITVTSYINLLDMTFWYGRPDDRTRDIGRWEPYLRFNPNIKLKYVYYYDSVLYKRKIPGQSDAKRKQKPLSLRAQAEQQAGYAKMDMSMLKTPAEIRKIIDLRAENNRYVMKVDYNRKSSFLRVFDDMDFFPSETETSAALERLLKPLPKIAFLQGHFERDIDRKGDRDYQGLTVNKPFRYALINQGFDVLSLDLQQQEIPSGITALVIADPRKAIDPISLARIKKYIDEGGNLLIAGEPGKQEILNPLLVQIGVKLLNGQLIQENEDDAPDFVTLNLNKQNVGLYKKLEEYLKLDIPVAMPGVAALNYDAHSDFKIEPVLTSNPNNTWNKVGAFVSDSAKVVFQAEQGDQKGSFPTVLKLTRQINGKEQRIIVAGDADFLSTLEMSRRKPKTANFGFATGLFGWFTYGSFPIDTSRPDSKDKRIRLTKTGAEVLNNFCMFILPGLLAAAGTIILIRRKRK